MSVKATADEWQFVCFFREDGMFYPLQLPASDDIAAYAECNPGTIKVVDMTSGETLWERRVQ